MRPRNQSARDQLRSVLARSAPVAAADLAAQLGVSVATLHRLLQEIEGEVIATGKARRSRYGLRRALRGDMGALPLYEIDRQGLARQIAELALIHPQGSCMDWSASGWPVADEARDGWWFGLPYPLYDMRPQGYLGRQLARAEHRQLGIAANPDEWGDDDLTLVLSRIGSDLSGNLILGDRACEKWQSDKLTLIDPIPQNALALAYSSLAEQAVANGVPGSSAGGEFPKFPALRELDGSDTPHVLVKFSGADGSPAVRRWADLLVCEHLALECAALLPGVASARSRIVVSVGRTFLEVERFDRHGLFGRSRLVSLATLDAALLGDVSNDWTRLAARLAALGLLSSDDLSRIEQLWWFGRLIANSDMHTGNLSFHPTGPQGLLHLAPVYDMLPMSCAPLPGGEVPPTRDFEPPLPLPAQRAVWLSACSAALAFWTRAADDARISAAFRRFCAASSVRLQGVAERV
jgi:hypothetical protein